MASTLRQTVYKVALSVLSAVMVSCGEGGKTQEQPGAAACVPLTGSPWVPRTGSSDPSSETGVSDTVLTSSGPVVGYSDPALESSAVTFRIPMKENLGAAGSVALVAEITDFPPQIRGGGVPLLVSVHDGRREWIPLERSGEVIACSNAGIFTCTLFGCEIDSACALREPSAYANLSQWLQRQVNPFAPLSVNLFPTCNWNASNPSCAFNTDFFTEGNHLRTGPDVDYLVRYLIVADSAGNAPAGTQAGIRLHVLKKKAEQDSGTLNFNLVLVGSTNIQASRTGRGQANLNALVGYLERHYGQNGSGIRIGRIRVFEWGCEQGGDAFASMEVSRLGELFKTGSQLLTQGNNGLADGVNVFLIGEMSDAAIQGTLLGVAGGIPGAMVNGTGASGVAIATFNRLDGYNARCPSQGPCPLELHDEDFWTLGTTISHETGHFLGLNHPSEGDGREHDAIPDTPTCSETDTIRGTRLITVNSCLRERDCRAACRPYDGKTRFCSEQLECEFNHLMWWTLKNYNPEIGQGDGNLLSSNSLTILRYHPLISR